MFTYYYSFYYRLSKSYSRGKKTTILASKKRKGESSSAGPTAKICHPLLQFLRGLQEELFQILRARPLIAGHCIDWAAIEQVQMADAIQALLTIEPWELFFKIIEPTYLELMMNYAQRSIFRPTASYNPSRSKASVLPPSLRYLHAILAHTNTGRQESTGVVNTYDVYFLWCMSPGHVIDRAYFIALEEAYEDILDDVPPQHEDPPTQPPPTSRPVHATASYADISECLT
ncbi:hypothetical protein GOBAR_AA36047 [Gossypium barbadense]|uniref:Uncharacterized protein n=1 Tax=Gossypium barbadense TaxID=3634 RepID=A0A2P5W0T3_GOSBA|nr:hypothetical protein GOBAR_AA36047 [Gossypium barbadense]